MTDNIFNIKDLIKYRTPMNPGDNWGVIVDILKVEDSTKKETKGTKLYRINPLDTVLGYYFIQENNILQAYSMYYEEKKD
ncbi:hypothetical protein PMW00_01870 [Clostridium paraputrificum]|uniref:hypothetical protein n=2 Tax=Clostridiaceae TaxID=31979 RepID=UPI00232A9226|nr:MULTISPECIES: hypothetical protein [Clostridium]MDB2101761.1 hypothetical protein [Clostridium paraputrificum]MDU4428734.1 hypothetical protein [Clostridium sp.]MDU5443100.1 hypothetical protein [Finegoldia magna]